MIFGTLNPEKIRRLSTSTVRCRSGTLGNRKKIVFNSIIHTYWPLCLYTNLQISLIVALYSFSFSCIRNPVKLRKQSVIHLPIPHLKISLRELWIAKLLHLTGGLLRSFRHWRLLREPAVGCRRWLWKEPLVMSHNWNDRQAMSQQVFKVTTFCINTCFQSFSTLISRIVHHTVLSPFVVVSWTCHKKLMAYIKHEKNLRWIWLAPSRSAEN